MVQNVWKELTLIVEGNILKEEERVSTRVQEPVFIDLTVGEKQVEEGELTGNESESESEESLLMDMSIDEESEIENENDGISEDYC